MTTVTSPTLGVDFTATPTSADFALGTKVQGSDGTEWVYVQASGAITQYQFVGIDENFQAAALTKAMADDGWAVGAAQSAFADDDYGWVAIGGSNVSGNLLTLCAADVALYTSGTAGALDDTASSQTKIDGIVAVTGGVTGTTATEVIMISPRSTTF
jgi:hypothetical protein